MRRIKNQSLKDLFHEFIIFVVFGLGIALPLIIYNVMDIFSQLNINYLISGTPFPGVS